MTVFECQGSALFSSRFVIHSNCIELRNGKHFHTAEIEVAICVVVKNSLFSSPKGVVEP